VLTVLLLRALRRTASRQLFQSRSRGARLCRRDEWHRASSRRTADTARRRDRRHRVTLAPSQQLAAGARANRVGGAVVFAERAIAPGAMRSGRPRSSTSRADSPPSANLDVAGVPARESSVAALEVWAGSDVSSCVWSSGVLRRPCPHAPPPRLVDRALLARCARRRAARRVRSRPREASAATLGFLGARPAPGCRRPRAGGDGYAACWRRSRRRGASHPVARGTRRVRSVGAPKRVLEP